MRLRDALGRPAGALRITTFKYAASTVLVPMLPAFLEAHPGIDIEISVDAKPVDIVAKEFSAGIRFGCDVDRDMVSIRVAPDVRNVVVAAPSYLARRGKPSSPDDLDNHDCIGLRMPGSGGLHNWVFERSGERLSRHIAARVVVDDSDLVLEAALAGQGCAYRLAPQVSEHIREGRLIPLLVDWSATTQGLHIYHPAQQQISPALRVLIDALRLPRCQAGSDPELVNHGGDRLAVVPPEA